MKKISKYLLLIFMPILFSFSALRAQPVADARAAMEGLYKLYDSTDFITFDVKYSYTTDTVYGDYRNEQMTGSYTMSGRKAKFTMAGIEYMQNDSFFVTVYDKEKIIIVANSRVLNTGSYMPMRESIDSILNAYSTHYNIAVHNDANDSAGYISFERADSIAAYDKFQISFDTQQKYITSMRFVFMEAVPVEETPAEESSAAREIIHRRTLNVEFLNYRFDNIDASNYDENNYIWFDEGEIKPVKKYEGYKVYNSRS